MGAVSGPGETGQAHGNLLDGGHSLDWDVDISDVGSNDAPFDRITVEIGLKN